MTSWKTKKTDEDAKTPAEALAELIEEPKPEESTPLTKLPEPVLSVPAPASALTWKCFNCGSMVTGTYCPVDGGIMGGNGNNDAPGVRAGKAGG